MIIPSTLAHARHLPEVLGTLAKQTLPPDEVSISISECPSPRAVDVNTLRRAAGARTKIIVQTDPRIAFAGKNRNRAADRSTGDLLIYQDADDLPHPQRIEILAHLFGRFHVDHVLHHYEYASSPSARSTWSSHRFAIRDAPTKAYYEPYPNVGYAHPFHNGNNATSRALLAIVRWPEGLRRGQDTAYNKACGRSALRGTMARLPWPLVTYRQFLSTTKIARKAS